MSGAPTMKDIAKACGGVHPSTVSLALRDSPVISLGTRKKIRAAARRLGYRPDPLLGAFNRRRVERQPPSGPEVMAYITDSAAMAGNRPFGAGPALWKACVAAAEPLHCRFEQFSIDEGRVSQERLAAILRARGIRSYVVATDQLTLDPADWSAFWGVRLNDHHRVFPRCIVASDHRNSVRMAVRELRAAGFERIGLALDPAAHPGDADSWSAGFYLAHMERGARDVVPVFDLPAGRAGKRNVAAWVRDHRLQAVLTTEWARAQYFASLEGTRASLPAVSLDLAASREGACGFIPNFGRLAGQAVGQLVGMVRSGDVVVSAGVSCTYVPMQLRGRFPDRSG